ncbi:MAG TPA: DUF1289 domain-containing protein [Pseudomonadales bacterium]|nr:DUF1289 domain-containing protein [Pseudomonadales bacterium]
MNTASPCIQVCKLDDCDMCTGCHRTRDEIARWTQMNDAEKDRVNSVVAERQFWAGKASAMTANGMP